MKTLEWKMKHLKALLKLDHSSVIADHIRITGHNFKWDNFDILIYQGTAKLILTFYLMYRKDEGPYTEFMWQLEMKHNWNNLMDKRLSTNVKPLSYLKTHSLKYTRLSIILKIIFPWEYV